MTFTDKDKERFFEKVEKIDGGCWLWEGGKMHYDYGRFHIKKKSYRAHRISYEMEFGEIPDDLPLRHTCDTPSCVNPEHLTPGTLAENTQDMIEAGNGAIGKKGDDHHLSKVTNVQAMEARLRYALGDIPIDAIAKKYKLSYAGMYNLLANKTWKHVGGPTGIIQRDRALYATKDVDYSKKLTAADVIAIRICFFNSDISILQIANKYDVSFACIKKILKFKTWKHVDGPRSDLSKEALVARKKSRLKKNDMKRFMERIKITRDGCWEWQHSMSADGYGIFIMENRDYRAHRASYELFKGEIPPGLFICHSCDNTKCVNPEHLTADTHINNMGDMVKKGRATKLIGNLHPNAKLMEADVKTIRERHANGNISQLALSREYNISTATMSMVINRKIWQHI